MRTFKTFLQGLTEGEIVDAYLNRPNVSITNLSYWSNKSVGEIYRILHTNHIIPNRQKGNHHLVKELAGSGLHPNKISQIVGYTPRNVWYILSKNR